MTDEERQDTQAICREIFGDESTAAIIDNWSSHMERWFTQVQGFSTPSIPTDLMLVVTELAEACEADRKEAESDKIPGFSGVEEELADTLVRILHMAGKHKLRLGAAFSAKMIYNLSRPFRHGKGY